MPIDREMDKQIVINSCHGILLSNKKDELLIHETTYMNLKIIKLSANSQTQKSTVYSVGFHLYQILEVKSNLY